MQRPSSWLSFHFETQISLGLNMELSSDLKYLLQWYWNLPTIFGCLWRHLGLAVSKLYYSLSNQHRRPAWMCTQIHLKVLAFKLQKNYLGFLDLKKNIRKCDFHTKYFKIKILTGKSFFRIKIFSLFLPIQLSFHSNADESWSENLNSA